MHVEFNMTKSYLLAPTIAKVLLILISDLFLHIADGSVGVCFGTLGNNLPPPPAVIDLINRNNIHQLRLFNPNPAILNALRGNPGIAVTVGIPNEEIPGIAGNPVAARRWVRNNILNFGNVNFRYIGVGNEVNSIPSLVSQVVPAMVNVQNALISAGLANRIKVSTTLSGDALGQSYPPSAGAFRPELIPPLIMPLVNFLLRTQSPLLVNMYPYLSYLNNQRDISLPYALFTSPGPVVTDGPYLYQNLFDAMTDAANAALEKVGGGAIPIVVSETGWPTDGAVAATVDNARIYNNNLANHVNRGTPRRPGRPVETYIFDLIDEDLKNPELEKHWGIFFPNLQPKYPITFPP